MYRLVAILIAVAALAAAYSVAATIHKLDSTQIQLCKGFQNLQAGYEQGARGAANDAETRAFFRRQVRDLEEILPDDCDKRSSAPLVGENDDFGPPPKPEPQDFGPSQPYDVGGAD